MSAGDGVWMVEVETTLLHGSGQFLSDVLAVPVTPASAQVVGSAITYARRYALAGFVGVAPAGEDDDAEASSAPPVRERRPVPAPAPALESAPPGAMDTATVKVLGIVKRILPSGKEKYVISGDDLKAYGTFALELATEAKRAQEAAAPIESVYKSTRYGLEVVTLREAGTDPPI
jgi:ERF superfamily